MSSFRLALFGPFGLVAEGREVPIRCVHARALLALLALQPRHSSSRDAVMDALWRDAPIDWCRKQLRQTLWRLRHDLVRWCDDTAPLVRSEGDRLALNDAHAIEIDVDDLHAAHARLSHGDTTPDALRAAEQVVEAARPGLLGDDVHEWCLIERERCENRLMGVLQMLADALAAQGEPQRALLWTQRLLELNPLHEPSHRRAIALHLALGDPAGAARQLARCTEVLRRELGVAPDVQTRALLAAAGSMTVLPAAGPSMERLRALSAELDALVRRLHDELDALDAKRG